MTAPAADAGSLGALERYEAVIGIEVHCQLRTASQDVLRLLDGLRRRRAEHPRLPGLPRPARRAADDQPARRGARPRDRHRDRGDARPTTTRWDRKNYFYPDLPKGYQISQYELPLAADGRLTFDTSDGPVTVGITRAHLEEDTAKLIHATAADGRRVSLVDFNRSGAPLMEIVTDPDVRSAEQARRYAEELQLLLRAIGASDADMERGQMRVEANVSLRPRGTEPFGTRVEVKNMNSFRSVERAIAYEIERQAAALDAGEPLTQETRGWDEDRGATYVMRSKEDSHDYRYFPEPDLPPLRVDAAWLDEIRGRLPELPAARRARYQRGVRAVAPTTPAVLVARAATRRSCSRRARAGSRQRRAEGGRELGHRRVPGLLQDRRRTRRARVDPDELADLVERVACGRPLPDERARRSSPSTPRPARPSASIVESRASARSPTPDALGAVVDEVSRRTPRRSPTIGPARPVVGFLVGQVMKATRGQANAALVQEAVVRERLDGEG